MNEIVTLVLRAQSATASEAERRDAFGKLVLRFQDMAFACALVMLGDRFLAADAAQEAFVTAWRRLGTLKRPEAFAVWLKRIVRTECSRITRPKRVLTVPLDAATAIAATTPDPTANAERGDHSVRTRRDRSVPPDERVATVMYYVDGLSHAEIAELRNDLAPFRELGEGRGCISDFLYKRAA